MNQPPFRFRPTPYLLVFTFFAAAACSGEDDRPAVGTARDPVTCAESELEFVLESPYGGAGSLEEPREWCGMIEGEMVCFLSKHNGGPFSGVQLARKLSDGEVPLEHPALHCWEREITAWNAEWLGQEYHPLWRTQL